MTQFFVSEQPPTFGVFWTRAAQDPDKARAEHPDFDADEAQERLNAVYERMNAMAASTAESRASRILHGLGFTVPMQRRSTQSFRCGDGV